ncbi:MAG: hypothetical protein IKA72_03320 [Clostridia bacterium]|nr:hypothetical protein [Clostridia bacterium]
MIVECHEKANIGPCVDVKEYEGRLFAIQNSSGYPEGRLCVLLPDFSLVATFEGIGNARQIEIVNDTAFITAREDGLFIFDISEDTPKLLCCYKTVEFATGIALYGNLAFVSCRVYGVQILDVSNPCAPVQISIARTGEVQSVMVKDGILYCGCWGNMMISVIDIRNPQSPKLLSEIPLQGRGDGVFIKDNVLYAATGGCARRYNPMDESTSDLRDSGNGLERFDVTDPQNPKRINGVFFERGVHHGVDYWEVSLYGETLLVNNSVVGVYGLGLDDLEQKFRVLPPKDKLGNNTPVTGITVSGKDIFVATLEDLFAVREMNVAEQEQNDGALKIAVEPRPFTFTGQGASLNVVYKGDFPVLGLAETDNHILLACYEGGMRVLDKETLSCCAVIQTSGPAVEVKVSNGKIYVAEGVKGLSVYKINGSQINKIGGLTTDSVYQIVLSNSGKYLMSARDGETLKMYDVEDPKNIQELYVCPPTIGLLYGNNFASNCTDDGTMLAFWHARGMIYSNPDKGDRQFFQINYTSKRGRFFYASGEGAETDGKNIFYVRGGKYHLLSTEHSSGAFTEEFAQTHIHSDFHGAMAIKDNLAIVTNRKKGALFAVDISDIHQPKLLADLATVGVLWKAVFIGERIFVPAERDGLLELKLQ